MSINYQRREFMRRAFYVGLAVGLPKPALAAMGVTAEAAQQQLAAQYFRWKIKPVMKRPPVVQYYGEGNSLPFGFNDYIDHVRIPQVSDDGEHWRDAERADLDALEPALAHTAAEHYD